MFSYFFGLVHVPQGLVLVNYNNTSLETGACKRKYEDPHEAY